MAQVVISDFKFGLDRRRPRVAGVPGTLWVGKNCHITRGGDIERAKKFVSLHTLPEGTFGLGQSNGQLWVWGSEDLDAQVDLPVIYSRLQINSLAAMTEVLYNNTFDGKHYVIAKYDDGTVHHFYDGVEIADWPTIGGENSSFTTLAAYLAANINLDDAVSALSAGPNLLVTAETPGTPFTIAVTAVNGGAVNDQTITATTIQANVAGVTEVRATGTVTITGGSREPGVNYVEQITVDGESLMDAPADWISSNDATAVAVSAKINNLTDTHGYVASVVGAIITIKAEAGSGTAPNGFGVIVTRRGDVTATTTNMGGGVAAVTAVAQVEAVSLGGTYESGDIFTVTINGTTNYRADGRSSGVGTSCFTYKGREWVTGGSLIYHSVLNDPDDFVTDTASIGAGFINTSNDSEGNERLLCMVQYQNLVAVFARKTIRIYELSTDSDENAFRQTLENIGTIAPRSVIPFTNTDVLFLDEAGVRSLKVRDLTGGAETDDIGSPVDTFIAEWIASLTEDAVSKAFAVIEPIDGRFMLAIGSRIFVLSHFPLGKIKAWSYYDPGFEVQAFARVDRKLYARSATAIYLYGGLEGSTYPAADEQTVEVQLPFVAAGDPATFKKWSGMDVACSGTWTLTLHPDPEDDTKSIGAGKVTKTTFGLPAIAVVGDHPIIAVKATCTRAGYASLSSVVLHYDKTETG